MTRLQYAASKGLTLHELWEQEQSFLQNEGFDDVGREYLTLDDWIARKPVPEPYEPVDGGRGVGDYGNG